MPALEALAGCNLLIGLASIGHRHWVQVVLPRRLHVALDTAPREDMPVDNEMSMQRRALLAQNPGNEEVERPKRVRVAPEGL